MFGIQRHVKVYYTLAAIVAVALLWEQLDGAIAGPGSDHAALDVPRFAESRIKNALGTLAGLEAANKLGLIDLKKDLPWYVEERKTSIMISLVRRVDREQNAITWEHRNLEIQLDDNAFERSIEVKGERAAAFKVGELKADRVRVVPAAPATGNGSRSLTWLASAFVKAYREIGIPAGVRSIVYDGTSWTVKGSAFSSAQQSGVAEHILADLVVRIDGTSVRLFKIESFVP